MARYPWVSTHGYSPGSPPGIHRFMAPVQGRLCHATVPMGCTYGSWGTWQSRVIPHGRNFGVSLGKIGAHGKGGQFLQDEIVRKSCPGM
jgi:hypothetical protein